MEDVLFKQLGTKSDYEREYRDKPVGKMIREIVGLDLNAANEIFSEFLNSQDLNANQIHFVKLIVDYVVKNGMLDKSVLREEPCHLRVQVELLCSEIERILERKFLKRLMR